MTEKNLQIHIPRSSELSPELMEQLKYDLKHNPARKLNSVEKRIYMKAVHDAIQNVPAFRDSIALMRPYVDPSASTAYTDQYARAAFGYWFFYIVNDDQRASILLHECMHVLNDHFRRSEEIDGIKDNPHFFNISGDLEINTVLNRVAYVDLSQAILPDHAPYFFPTMQTMEHYAALLWDKQNKEEEACPKHGKEAREKAKEERDKAIEEERKRQQERDECDVHGKDSAEDEDGAEQDSSEGDSGDQSDPQCSCDQGDDSDTGDDGEGSDGDQGSEGDSGEGSEGDSGDGSEGDSGEGEGSGEGDSGEGEGSGEGSDCTCGKDQREGKGQPGSAKGKPGNGQPGSGQGQHGVNPGGGRGQPGGNPSDTGESDGWECDELTPDKEAAADAAGIERASDTEKAIAKANTVQRILQERNREGRGLGSGNSVWDVLLSQLLPKKVDWRKVFRAALAQTSAAVVRGRQDYTYRRPNRRAAGTDLGKEFILPGMVNYIPKVMLGVDTSGSMGNEDYQRALTEIEGITREISKGRDSLSMFSVDTQVGAVKPVSKVSQINLQGGGGTMMAVAWQYIEKEVPAPKKPDIFILATDGGIDWPEVLEEVTKAKFKSIILVTQKYGYDARPTEIDRLATVICIDENA